MSTNFPTSLDTFTNPAGTDPMNTGIGHAAVHDNVNDAVAALEAKVGVNGSAVTTSLDYKIAHASGAVVTPGELRSASSVATFEPILASSTVTLSGGGTQYTFFTSPISFTTAQVRYALSTAATSSGAGTSIGLYSVDSSDNGTLIASVSSTTLFSSGAGTTITKSWAVSAAITAGQRYALGFLNITGSGSVGLAAAPVQNSAMSSIGNEMALTPRLTALWGFAQTSQVNFTAANVNGQNATQAIYSVIL